MVLVCNAEIIRLLVRLWCSVLVNSGAFSNEDLEIFAADYSAPGVMRAGLDVYRAFGQDNVNKRESLKKKRKTFCSCSGGGW